jgi:hypothetical protein
MQLSARASENLQSGKNQMQTTALFGLSAFDLQMVDDLELISDYIYCLLSRPGGHHRMRHNRVVGGQEVVELCHHVLSHMWRKLNLITSPQLFFPWQSNLTRENLQTSRPRTVSPDQAAHRNLVARNLGFSQPSPSRKPVTVRRPTFRDPKHAIAESPNED